MEAVLLYTTQVMPALKPVNFLSVKNMLEEGLLGHDHITLNTTAYDRPSPFEFPLPSVEGGYGYYLEVHNLSIRS